MASPIKTHIADVPRMRFDAAGESRPRAPYFLRTQEYFGPPRLSTPPISIPHELQATKPETPLPSDLNCEASASVTTSVSPSISSQSGIFKVLRQFCTPRRILPLGLLAWAAYGNFAANWPFFWSLSATLGGILLLLMAEIYTVPQESSDPE